MIKRTFWLNLIKKYFKTKKIYYWRDKQGHEIDFIVYKNIEEPITIECKWQASNFNINNLRIFRKKYHKGKNYLVTHDCTKPYNI